MNWSRRDFLAATAAATAAAATRAGAQAPDPPPKVPKNPTVYRFAIGDLEAFSFSDGHMFFRDPLNLMHPEDQRPAMTAALEAESERTDGLPLYINILAVRVGAEIALFDGGFGAVRNPDYGWLAEGFAQAGLARERVTAAFLSHAHIDHIGGFVTGNKPAFPNAALYLLKEELEFWHRPEPDFSHSRRSKADLPGMIKSNRERFEILRPHLHAVEPGTRVLGDAITLEAAPGHTSGHAAFRIASRGESLLHIMDAVHHHILMFANPGWTIAFDHLPELAVDTRRKLFARESAARTRLYGFHLPWPGLGRVIASGSGYRWMPERIHWGR